MGGAPKSGTFSTHLRSYSTINEIFQTLRDGTTVQALHAHAGFSYFC